MNNLRKINIILFILVVKILCAQLNGTYDLCPSGCYFNSFAQLADTLYLKGISDKVSINVSPGIYDEGGVIFKEVGGALAGTTYKAVGGSKYVYIQSSTGNSSDVVLRNTTATNATNYVVKLDSACRQYVFSNMKINPTHTTFGRGVHFDKITFTTIIDSCILQGVNTSSSSDSFSLIYFEHDINNIFQNRCFITNSKFTYGSYGVFSRYQSHPAVPSSTQLPQTTEIINNQFDSCYAGGIYMQYAKGIVIKGNRITNSVNAATFAAVELNTVYNDNVKGIIISNNLIIDTISNIGFGIKMSAALLSASSPSAQKPFFGNNMINVGKSSGSGAYGIYINAYSGPDSMYISNNSIIVNSNSTRGIYLGNTTNRLIHCINNIIDNKGRGLCIFVTDSLDLTTLDYNNYTVDTASLSFLGYWNGTVTKQFSSWKTITNKEINSLNVKPLFYSGTDLRICQDSLYQKGKTAKYVTDDLFGTERDPSNPTIGAYELVFSTVPAFTNSCYGDTIVLQASNTYTNYNWSNGDTVSFVVLNGVFVNDTIILAASNLFCSFADTDTAIISVVNFSVDLGNDTLLCFGDTIWLDAGNPGYKYLWNNNSNSQFKPAFKEGISWVRVIDLPLMCDTLYDTIYVTELPAVNVSLGNDTSICVGDSLVLDAGNPDGSHLWSTGNTNQQIIINDEGNYYVEVENQGCYGNDTIVITLDSCGNNTLVQYINNEKLVITPNPNNGFFNIQFNHQTNWNTLIIYDLTGEVIVNENIKGLNSKSINISNFSSGIYLLELQGDGSRKAKDKLVITK